MATDFRSEVVVEACDGAAIEITNNFPFLAELGRLSPVLPVAFPAPKKRVPGTETPRIAFPWDLLERPLHGRQAVPREAPRARPPVISLPRCETCFRGSLATFDGSPHPVFKLPLVSRS